MPELLGGVPQEHLHTKGATMNQLPLETHLNNVIKVGYYCCSIHSDKTPAGGHIKLCYAMTML